MPDDIPSLLTELAEDFSPLELAFALFQAGLEAKLPVVLWRMPNTHEVQVLVAHEVQTQLPALEGPEKGFAFCPFQVSEEVTSNFLPATLYYSGKAGEMPQEEKENLPERFWAVLRKRGRKPILDWPLSSKGTAKYSSRAEFEQAVSTAVQAMKAGELEKVVLSRTKTLPLPLDFDLLSTYTQLVKRYDTAFVSLVAIPDVGTWMGASPELLAQIDKNRVFRTVALAGTQPLTPGLTPADAIWRQKEIEEQALVQRYIISCFKHIRLRDYIEVGPRTILAGNLLHLRTDYSAPMDELGFPNLGTQMLELLHPTSAVGGMPRAKALEMIRQLEPHERRYYSGFLGPIQISGETNLGVNLRCVELGKDTVTAYAGAGMTADSDPAKEWQETELKMQTMLRLFQASES